MVTWAGVWHRVTSLPDTHIAYIRLSMDWVWSGVSLTCLIGPSWLMDLATLRGARLVCLVPLGGSYISPSLAYGEGYGVKKIKRPCRCHVPCSGRAGNGGGGLSKM